MLKKLTRDVGDIYKVVVTVDPLNLVTMNPARKTTQRQCIREACRKIAAARSGLPLEYTVWNDCGDAATGRMLDLVLPNGHTRAN